MKCADDGHARGGGLQRIVVPDFASQVELGTLGDCSVQ